MKCFIDDAEEFILYGAGEVGVKAATALMARNYSVLGFLDKKKQGIEPNTGVAIYKLNSSEEKLIDRNAIVVICLADGMQHKSVSENLRLLGYDRIVMLPIEYSVPTIMQAELIKSYNYCISGFPERMTEMYSEADCICFPMSNDNSIESDFGDTVICRIPIEIVYSEDINVGNRDLSKVFTLEENQNINISAFIPYLSIYEFLDGKISNCDDLWDSYKEEPSDEFKIKELINRQKLYEVYEKKYQFGMDFFVQSAPDAEWDRNRFVITGGHHRIAYLVEKGVRYLPLRISKAHFEEWCNYSNFDLVEKVVNNERFAISKIAHPAFFEQDCINERYINLVQDAAFKWFRRNKRKPQSVLDASGYNGHFARLVARTAHGNCVVLSKNEQEAEITKEINQLLFLKEIEIVDDLINIEGKRHEVVFLLNNHEDSMEACVRAIEGAMKYAGKFVIIDIPSDMSVGIESYANKCWDAKTTEICSLVNEAKKRSIISVGLNGNEA